MVARRHAHRGDAVCRQQPQSGAGDLRQHGQTPAAHSADDPPAHACATGVAGLGPISVICCIGSRSWFDLGLSGHWVHMHHSGTSHNGLGTPCAACTRSVEMRCPSQRQQQNPRHQRKPLLLVLRTGHVLTRICTLSTFGGRGLGVRFRNFSINAAICCRPLAKASRSSRRRLLPGGDKRRSAEAPTSAVAAHPKRF